MKKDKLPNYPNKPNKKSKKLSIPNLYIEYKEFNCTFWLSFKNVPMTSKDAVIACNPNDGEIIGSAGRMIFPPTGNALFPLMVQMDDMDGEITINYYSTKHKTVYSFDDIEIVYDGIYGTPNDPYKLNVEDALALKEFLECF